MAAGVETTETGARHPAARRPPGVRAPTSLKSRPWRAGAAFAWASGRARPLCLVSRRPARAKLRSP